MRQFVRKVQGFLIPPVHECETKVLDASYGDLSSAQILFIADIGIPWTLYNRTVVAHAVMNSSSW